MIYKQGDLQMYSGPYPKDIDIYYPAHTHDLVTCLVNGEQKRVIQSRYLQKFGHTRETYLIKFPNAPLKSLAASESYRRVATSPIGRKQRSDSLRNSNLNNKEFQETRKASVNKFWKSERSTELRKNKSILAIKQHEETDLEDRIRKYYKERHPGSDAQKQASIRATLNNPGNAPGSRKKARETYIKNSELGLHNSETKFKKKVYEETSLMYQSTYELDFLKLCDNLSILNRIKNSPCLSGENYPYNFYAPDYILDNEYVIEIKSWYIENLQEKRCPGILQLKEQLVIDKGYKFLYIKDKDYSNFITII